MEELRVVCVFICWKMELRYWWECSDEKTRINKMNEERSLIPLGLRVPIWKRNFCSRVLQLSELHGCKETPQSAMCCKELQERLKCMETGLHASLSLLSKSRRCSRSKSPSHLSVPPIYLFLQWVHVLQLIILAGVHVKWSSILMDRSAPEITFVSAHIY